MQHILARLGLFEKMLDNFLSDYNFKDPLQNDNLRRVQHFSQGMI